MEFFPFQDALPVSARGGDGLEALKRVIIRYLPAGPPLFPDDYLTDQPMRFLAAEIVRERILRTTREEVPHAAAILIEAWEETPRLVTITATIYVERSGQRIILIGNKGQMLKRIGTAAREELEQRLNRKVHLSLFVKVRSNWRQDPEFLNAMDWHSMVGSEKTVT
jgi:GTP-binding protein Era